jgi:hypothetical protein
MQTLQSALFVPQKLTGSRWSATAFTRRVTLIACESPSRQLFLFNQGDAHRLSSYDSFRTFCLYNVRTR